jgi:hypothetical protein
MLGFIEILRNELFETEGPPNRAVFSLVSKNLISCFFKSIISFRFRGTKENNLRLVMLEIKGTGGVWFLPYGFSGASNILLNSI